MNYKDVCYVLPEPYIKFKKTHIIIVYIICIPKISIFSFFKEYMKRRNNLFEIISLLTHLILLPLIWYH